MHSLLVCTDSSKNAIQTVPGLEHVQLFRPGYAIEYDFFPPTQLYHTLETKLVKNLFFAGQINGTTGYEEAGGQGLVAGVNAHIKCHGGQPFVLGRDEAYIGVLIDDLVTKGVDEPYRMFTSRAEYRILLRQDDADTRLTEKSYRLGLAKQDRFDQLKSKEAAQEKLTDFLNRYPVKPTHVNAFLLSKGSTELSQGCKLGELLEKNGFDVEHKAYRPHVTVARRYRSTLPFSEVTKSVDVFNKAFYGTEAVLYKSVLGKGAPQYVELYRISLPLPKQH